MGRRWLAITVGVCVVVIGRRAVRGVEAEATPPVETLEQTTDSPEQFATPLPASPTPRKHPASEKEKPKALIREAFLIEPDPLAPLTNVLKWLTKVLKSPTTGAPLDLLPELVTVGQQASRVAQGALGVVNTRYEVEAGSSLWNSDTVGIGAVRANLRGARNIGAPADRDLSANLGADDVNDVALPYRIALRTWWSVLELPDRRLRVDIGKIDPTNFFDLNLVANIEQTQFISGGLVNNPAIPFPDDGIGIHLRWRGDGYSLRAGTLDANGTPTTTGFHSLAEGRLLGLGEFVLQPEIPIAEESHLGNYRFIMWGTNNKDATGVGAAVSFDQSLPDGFIPFFRYGYAQGSAVNPRTLPFHWFVSGGIGVRPLQRHDDLIALGATLGESVAEVPGKQGTIELFWRVQLSESIQISPDLQLAWQPATGGGPVVLPGLRGRWSFGGVE